MIRANCRVQFTAADFDFVAKTLSSSGRGQIAVERLLMDAGERESLIGRDEIFQALINLPHPLPVSQHFFFYVVTRHTLAGKGIDSCEVVDYVASVLVSFSNSCRLQPVASTLSCGEYLYLVDLLVAAENAPPGQVYVIHSQIGNYSLFMAGIFPEHLRYRVWRSGAPGIPFYEEMGSSSYRIASEHQLAHRHALAGVYRQISECFSDIRRALNDLSTSVLHWEHCNPIGGEGGPVSGL